MAVLLFLFLLFIFIFISISISISFNVPSTESLGINYGTLGDNLPPPSRSVKLIQSLSADAVKIYDANFTILSALSSTGLKVVAMVPNQLIVNISASHSVGDDWVRKNILPFRNKIKLMTLLVGNEILTDYGNKEIWYHLVPAMRNLRKSLARLKLQHVRIGTTSALECIQSYYPPSAAEFRDDIAIPVIKPLLRFLRKTHSAYSLNAYPYFVWAANLSKVGLDYPLLGSDLPMYTDPKTGLKYTNLLDHLIDAVYSAMAKLGFPDGIIPVTLAETGWPNAGDLDQIGANIHNAAIYNRNLGRKLSYSTGTPAKPNQKIEAFVFALYNENQKGGQGTERHWGVFHPNATPVYEVDFSGKRKLSAYPPLPAATNDSPYMGKIWCVVDEAAEKGNDGELGGAMGWACGQGNGTCDALQKGKDCYEPNTLVAHSSYAFNSYWQQLRKSSTAGASCYFNGMATQTAVDPSYGNCKFIAV